MVVALENVSHLPLTSPLSPWLIPNPLWIGCIWNKCQTCPFCLFGTKQATHWKGYAGSRCDPDSNSLHPAHDTGPLCIVDVALGVQEEPTVYFDHVKPRSHAPPLSAFITPRARALPPWLLPGALGFSELYPPDPEPASPDPLSRQFAHGQSKLGGCALSVFKYSNLFIWHAALMAYFYGFFTHFFMNNWCPEAARILQWRFFPLY